MSLLQQQTDLIYPIEGSLDALAVEIMRPRFDHLIEEQQDIVLDFSQVNFVDSSGIGAIVYLFKRLKASNKTLQIQGAKGQPLELFKHLRIDKSINIRAL
jgi:anti-anti-sigma factor